VCKTRRRRAIHFLKTAYPRLGAGEPRRTELNSVLPTTARHISVPVAKITVFLERQGTGCHFSIWRAVGGLAGKRLTVALFATARHFEIWRAVAFSRELLTKLPQALRPDPFSIGSSQLLHEIFMFNPYINLARSCQGWVPVRNQRSGVRSQKERPLPDS
jgi:hypothetical protein